MILCLADLLDDFPGAANQTRCFAHTISISAKSIIKQFDIPKAKRGEVLDEAAQALADLAMELDIAEQNAQETSDDDEDNDGGPWGGAWVDFGEGLSEEERKNLDVSIQPVRSMLVKVC